MRRLNVGNYIEHYKFGVGQVVDADRSLLGFIKENKTS